MNQCVRRYEKSTHMKFEISMIVRVFYFRCFVVSTNISVNLSLEMSDEPFSCVVRYDVLAWMVT